jgi:hypothetical protein
MQNTHSYRKNLFVYYHKQIHLNHLPLSPPSYGLPELDSLKRSKKILLHLPEFNDQSCLFIFSSPNFIFSLILKLFTKRATLENHNINKIQFFCLKVKAYFLYYRIKKSIGYKNENT